MARPDPHSYADQAQPQTKSISLNLEADFAARTLSGEIALHFQSPGAGPLDLDTRGLVPHSVTSLSGEPLEHALAASDPILGARLRITLPAASADPLHHLARRERAAVALAGADGGRRAPVPLLAVPAHPRALARAAAGFAGGPHHHR